MMIAIFRISEYVTDLSFMYGAIVSLHRVFSPKSGEALTL